MNQETALKSVGCKDIERYTLINNYGYSFIKDGVKYDLRNWLNCYGEAVDYWELSKVEKCFDTFKEAVEFIKSL